MRWVAEPNKRLPQLPFHALVLDPGEPLLPGFVEFWKRVLTDGQSLPPAARTRLNVEISPTIVDKNGWGRTSAKFFSSPTKQSEGIAEYRLRSDHFVFPDVQGEAPEEFDRRELAFTMRLYGILKEALRDPQARPLFERLNTTQPLAIYLSTANGWFALQPNQQDFGPLPASDRLLLAGKESLPNNPFLEQSSDGRWIGIMQEFNDALIQYTPAHFKTIHCKLAEGLEQGQRALFYEIRCPDFPNQGMNQANDRLHRAGIRVFQHLTAKHGAFPGVLVKLSAQPDGTWQSSFELLNRNAAG